MIELYKAFDKNGILRYVGIGKPGRHRHVNSGKSHSDILNACFAVSGDFDIAVQFFYGDTALADAKAEEIRLIAEHGRLHLGTGTLLNRSRGGEESSTCFDRSWYSSPDGKQSKRVRDETSIPRGWVPGRANIRGRVGWGSDGRMPPVRKNWKAWYNKQTGEIRQVPAGELPPEGFVVGTGLNPIGKKMWCHDPLSGKNYRLEVEKIPSSFVRGRK